MKKIKLKENQKELNNYSKATLVKLILKNEYGYSDDNLKELDTLILRISDIDMQIYIDYLIYNLKRGISYGEEKEKEKQ